MWLKSRRMEHLVIVELTIVSESWLETIKPGEVPQILSPPHLSL